VSRCRLLRQEAGDGGCIAGMLLVPKREDAHACRLRLPPQSVIGMPGTHRSCDAVELERIDDEMKTIGELLLRFICRWSRVSLGRCIRMIVSLLSSAQVLLPRSAVFQSVQVVGIFRHMLGKSERMIAQRGLPHGWCRAPRAPR